MTITVTGWRYWALTEGGYGVSKVKTVLEVLGSISNFIRDRICRSWKFAEHVCNVVLKQRQSVGTHAAHNNTFAGTVDGNF